MLDRNPTNIENTSTPSWVSQQANKALLAYQKTHGQLHGWARDAFLAKKRREAIEGHTPPSTQTSAH